MSFILNLNEELSNKITQHCGNVYRRRLFKDLEDLVATYPNINVIFDDILKVPYVLVIHNENVIKITLHKCFPFKGPIIELDGEPYSKILIYTNAERKKALKDLKGIDCLCCESYICESNWKIQSRLKEVVDEVLKNIEINKEVDAYIRIQNNEFNNINNISNDSNKKRKIH